MTSFFHQPRLLEKAVREALEVHRKIAEPSGNQAKLWLDEILRRLTGATNSQVLGIAEELRLSELRVLAQYLPRLEDDDDLFRKVVLCLRCRPDRAVCEQLWGMLGKWCDSKEFVRTLDELRADPEWWSLVPNGLPNLPRPMGSGERIALWLSRSYASGETSWLKACGEWAVLSPDTPAKDWERLALGRHTLRDLLLGPTGVVFAREESSRLLRWANELLRTFDEIKSFAHLYLRSVRIELWADKILDRIVEVLGDPRLKEENWRGVEKRIIDAIILRINTRKLEKFFLEAAGDHERFYFWRNFVADMGPLSTGNIEAGQGLFEFPGFGVVEFMEIGNAAYLYETDEFEAALLRIGKPNAWLKDKNACIDRIHHRGAWQPKWIPAIRTMIERGKLGRRIR